MVESVSEMTFTESRILQRVDELVFDGNEFLKPSEDLKDEMAGLSLSHTVQAMRATGEGYSKRKLRKTQASEKAALNCFQNETLLHDSAVASTLVSR